jgi:hypothetical protein
MPGKPLNIGTFCLLLARHGRFYYVGAGTANLKRPPAGETELWE